MISAQEKQQKLKFAILSYFFDGSIQVISNVRKPPEDSVFVSIDILKYHYRLKMDIL